MLHISSHQQFIGMAITYSSFVVLLGGKYLENFFTIKSQDVMDPDGSNFNQDFAFPLKENRKRQRRKHLLKPHLSSRCRTHVENFQCVHWVLFWKTVKTDVVLQHLYNVWFDLEVVGLNSCPCYAQLRPSNGQSSIVGHCSLRHWWWWMWLEQRILDWLNRQSILRPSQQVLLLLLVPWQTTGHGYAAPQCSLRFWIKRY